MKHYLLICASVMLLMPALLPAQDGAEIAGNACAMCHQLSPDGAGGSPNLFDLAKQHKPFNAEKLQSILEQPQHTVAKSQVQESDLAALSEYLNSLQ